MSVIKLINGVSLAWSSDLASIGKLGDGIHDRIVIQNFKSIITLDRNNISLSNLFLPSIQETSDCSKIVCLSNRNELKYASIFLPKSNKFYYNQAVSQNIKIFDAFVTKNSIINMNLLNRSGDHSFPLVMSEIEDGYFCIETPEENKIQMLDVVPDPDIEEIDGNPEDGKKILLCQTYTNEVSMQLYVQYDDTSLIFIYENNREVHSIELPFRPISEVLYVNTSAFAQKINDVYHVAIVGDKGGDLWYAQVTEKPEWTLIDEVINLFPYPRFIVQGSYFAIIYIKYTQELTELNYVICDSTISKPRILVQHPSLYQHYIKGKKIIYFAINENEKDLNYFSTILPQMEIQYTICT
jgi:hypothetical protein